METRPAPCKGAGRGVYYHLARRTGVRESAEDLENRILRIQDGFNEKNKLASNEFIFNLKRTHPTGPPSGMPAEIERRV